MDNYELFKKAWMLGASSVQSCNCNSCCDESQMEQDWKDFNANQFLFEKDGTPWAVDENKEGVR